METIERELLEVIGRVEKQKLDLLIKRDQLNKEIAEIDTTLSRLTDAYATKMSQKTEGGDHG